MCDARDPRSGLETWGPVDENEMFRRLLRDVLDNLVDLPSRDEEFVRRQLIAFANCVRQQMSKEAMFNMGEAMITSALRHPEDGLKAMLNRMDVKEASLTPSKTSGDSTTSHGNPFDGAND